jgi:exosortase E/protease (VPEID-CTERM system)
MRRLGGPAALLVAEYVALSLLVDFPTGGPARALVDAARMLVPAVLGAGAAAILLARHASAGGAGGEVAALPARPGWPWLLAHLASFAVTAALGRSLMAPGAVPSAGAFAAWCGCVAVTVILAVAMAASPVALLRIAARRVGGPVFAAAVGLLSWRAVVEVDRLWGILQDGTLRATGAVLRLVARDVVVVPGEAMVGVGEFVVRVAPVCSGADGVGLVLLFQGLWISLARERIRVGRALLVLPAAGVVAALAANVFRIAALVLLGASGREDLALGAFHSKLGWLLFIAISFASIAAVEHTPWLRREHPRTRDRELPPAVAAYVAPLLAALATALVTSAWSQGGFDVWYGARVVAGVAALAACRRALPRPALAFSWVPIGIAAAASALWIRWGGMDGSTLGAALAGVDPLARAGWLAVRILGACLVLPVLEELAFRGFLLPWLVSFDFEQLPPRTWSWTAVALSSLAFGALHERWLLGAAAGVLFACARLWRGRLGDAIVAHAACNGALAVVVLATGRWELWG